MKRLRVMTVAICVLWAGAAAAQTASVLVSNVNQGTDIDQTIGEPHVAQPFTTGTASTAGFSITAITIETKKADDTFALAVCGVQTADGVPDVPNATCTAFTAPTDGFSAIGDKTFTHSGMNVEPSTTYAVSIRVTSTIQSNQPEIEATAADTEDSVSMTGWSIHNKHRWYRESDTKWMIGNNNSYRLKIEGFVNTFPVMAERMGDGITLSWVTPANIAGVTLTGYEYRYARSESELDSKPYTALGRRTEVQITDFPVYDRLYYFDVRTRSDQGPGNTSRITATPQRRVPSAVQYLRVIPGQDSLYLAWRPPESPGYIVLTGYEYRYAQGSTVPDGTSWMEVPQQTKTTQPDPDVTQYDGPSLSVNIHFLMSDQLYTVEVRAINGDTAPHNKGTVARATVMTDVTPPQLVRATVDGDMLALDYNEDLASGMLNLTSFTGISGTVTEARVTGARVILTLDPAVMAGDTVTLNYTGSGEIADLAHNAAAAFNDHPVVNVTGQDKLDVTPPALMSAEVAGYTLVATWDEELDPQWVPLPLNFTVSDTSKPHDQQAIVVDRVQLCGTKVTLTLAKSFFDYSLHLQYEDWDRGLRDLAGNRPEESTPSVGASPETSVAGCSGTSQGSQPPSTPPGGGGGTSTGGGTGTGTGTGTSTGGRGGGGGGGGPTTTEEEPELIGNLENPGADSFQSGIGVISGWVCAADEVEIELNGVPQAAAYGTERSDTEETCGDTDNGFGLLFNWNLLGDGEHEVVAFVDDVELGRATVTVTTLGAEFVRGVTGTCEAPDFPMVGETGALVWQETQQNFVIVDGERPRGTNRAGSAGVGHLDNPGADSFQSGIGVISGWVCEGDTVEIQIGTAGRQVAAYGTERRDTESACGDTDNGFGLLFNWNLLGDGEHAVVAYVDDVELGRATVRVTTLGEEFVRGVEGECVVEDFPTVGETVTLEWQQNSQNFVITAVE